MKIIVEYENYDIENLNIETAKYIGDFVVEIEFSDGFKNRVDFKSFLSKSIHPTIVKYLDEKKFVQYEIIGGNLNWNDYEMIFPIADLYEGKI